MVSRSLFIVPVAFLSLLSACGGEDVDSSLETSDVEPIATASEELSCGSACTECVLVQRADILPFYASNGWDTTCGNRDNIVANWCGIDPAGCNAVRSGACAASCGVSPPVQVPVLNGTIETATTPQFGDIYGFGLAGGWAFHDSNRRDGRSGLGLRFGYYSSGNWETVAQVLTTRFVANRLYTFRSYATGGTDNKGSVPYEIGYAEIDGMAASFRLLARQIHATGSTWVRTAGVSYRTGSTGVPIGKQIAIRFSDTAVAVPSDIWFDNVEVTSAP
ncbi:hypothetical protein [Sorangium sp. So ce1389]|uniref:hypothetical protein n=1 Tax=Sorangium sp. So ce1389 TaxID=3133336 RepID=UPI003F61D718